MNPIGYLLWFLVLPVYVLYAAGQWLHMLWIVLWQATHGRD